MVYTDSFEESVRADLQELNSLTLSTEQKKAIRSRDYNKARNSGLNLNEYLYLISLTRYRSKLCSLIA